MLQFSWHLRFLLDERVEFIFKLSKFEMNFNLTSGTTMAAELGCPTAKFTSGTWLVSDPVNNIAHVAILKFVSCTGISVFCLYYREHCPSTQLQGGEALRHPGQTICVHPDDTKCQNNIGMWRWEDIPSAGVLHSVANQVKRTGGK